MSPQSRTIIVSNLGRCWKLKGTNRSICEATYSIKGSKKIKNRKTLMAFSDNQNYTEINPTFEMDIECSSEDIKKGLCTPKHIVLQPIKCDPKSEKCDPYYYRNA